MSAPETFEQVLDDACTMLAKGPVDRSIAAHTPVVGTSDGDLRVMVLRHFDRERMTLRFHTDLRAPKCVAIADDPRVHVLIYDRDRKVQLRLSGSGEVTGTGADVDEAWGASTPFARRCYMGEAPGAPSPTPTSGLPSEVEGIAPSDDQLRDARRNFAILTIGVDEIDWFFLDHHGHRRAIIDLIDRSRDRWVAP